MLKDRPSLIISIDIQKNHLYKFNYTGYSRRNLSKGTQTWPKEQLRTNDTSLTHFYGGALREIMDIYGKTFNCYQRNLESFSRSCSQYPRGLPYNAFSLIFWFIMPKIGKNEHEEHFQHRFGEFFWEESRTLSTNRDSSSR